jgi:hypothetical protein
MLGTRCVSELGDFQTLECLHRLYWLSIPNAKIQNPEMLQNPKLFEHYVDVQKVSDFGF